MKIVPSFIPPVSQQPRLNGDADKTVDTGEEFAELVGDYLPVPITGVEELKDTLPQFESRQRFSERVDLRSFRDEGLPLSNQRALESYRTVANNGPIVDVGLARLDLLV